MMHIANPSTVVTLEDANTGKPFREYDHSRSPAGSRVRVVLPFDTEYRFRFAFPDTSGTRRRLELDIDGTTVAKDLILTHGVTLERFLDSDKRFKFVRTTAEGVANPASPDNGVITVKLWPEKPAQYFGNVLRGMSSSYTGRGANTQDWGYVASPGYQGIGGDIVYCSASNPAYEAGATVEGAKSSQQFGTTEWRGDELSQPHVFIFQLVGRVVQAGGDSGMFCAQCGAAHSIATAKFCSQCGVRK